MGVLISGAIVGEIDVGCVEIVTVGSVEAVGGFEGVVLVKHVGEVIVRVAEIM